MEFLICLLLAAMIRPVSDAFHAAKGVEPPHLSKARLAASRPAPATSPGVPGRGTAKDVWDAYWGGAMADIAAHRDRVRAEKKAGIRPPVEARLKRLGRLLWEPVGEPKPEPDRPAPAVPETPAPAAGPDSSVVHPEANPVQDGDYGWACDICGTHRVGYRSRADAALDSQNHPCAPPTPNKGEATPSTQEERDAQADGDTARANRGGQNHPRTEPTPDKGDDMTDTPQTGGGSATGDAHDLESAIHECDLLGDDLTRIDTSLDVIDEAITSAGSATEGIEAFLRSKNVDDTTVGGMSVARDMLSPTHIKALIDAIAAAKAGVQATHDLLVAMKEGADEALQGADGSVVNGR